MCCSWRVPWCFEPGGGGKWRRQRHVVVPGVSAACEQDDGVDLQRLRHVPLRRRSPSTCRVRIRSPRLGSQIQNTGPRRPEIAPQVKSQPGAGCAVLTEIVAEMRDRAIVEAASVLSRRCSLVCGARHSDCAVSRTAGAVSRNRFDMCGGVTQARGPLEYRLVDGTGRARQPHLELSGAMEWRAVSGVSGYLLEPQHGGALKFPAEPMCLWPISKRVNTPKNDDPSLLDQVADEAA